MDLLGPPGGGTVDAGISRTVDANRRRADRRRQMQRSTVQADDEIGAAVKRGEPVPVDVACAGQWPWTGRLDASERIGVGGRTGQYDGRIPVHLLGDMRPAPRWPGFHSGAGARMHHHDRTPIANVLSDP